MQPGTDALEGRRQIGRLQRSEQLEWLGIDRYERVSRKSVAPEQSNLAANSLRFFAAEDGLDLKGGTNVRGSVIRRELHQISDTTRARIRGGNAQ